MDVIHHILTRIDRRPRAKRRFNLFLEEPAAHRGRQRKSSVLAPFLLFTTIPLAGWQIQSDLDLSLAPPRHSGGFADITKDRSAHWDAFPETSLAREDSDKGADFVAPAKAGSGHPMHREGRASPKAARRTSTVHTKERAFYRKAQGYHKEKNFEMAAKLYRRVLRENPAHGDALFHLASIYLEQLAYADAYPMVLELVSLDPNDAQALVNLAIAEIGLGKPGKAILHLEKALTLKRAPRFKIFFHQGVALSRLQRLEEAITWYKKSEALDPGHGLLLFNMAVTYDKLGRYDEALRCYARFLKVGGSASPQECRNVEARIGVLMAYLAEESGPSAEKTDHSLTE